MPKTTNEKKTSVETPNVIKSRLESEREEDMRMMKGRFLCHEPKGGNVTFSVKKYKGEKVNSYTMYDGQTYDVPKYVAKHINECGWDVHSHVLDTAGNPTVANGRRERRFTFESLDFI